MLIKNDNITNSINKKKKEKKRRETKPKYF